MRVLHTDSMTYINLLGLATGVRVTSRLLYPFLDREYQFIERLQLARD